MSHQSRVRNSDARVFAAGYGRVSTADQASGYGVADQDAAFDKWERENPAATIVGRFYDLAVSGSLETRDEMMKVESLARAGEIDCIVVPRVDRIGRTVRASTQWVWRMQDIGVHFIAIYERIDTSDQRGMERFLRCVEFAELEWRNIRERMMGGKEIKTALGGWPGGPAPFGFEIVGKGRRGSVLGPNPAEIAVLEEAVALIVDEGLNYGRAAASLNGLGLFTRSGVPWTGANLRMRLESAALDGYVTYRNTGRQGPNATRIHEDGAPVYGESVKLPVPTILDPARVAALRAAMKGLERENKRRPDEDYPLSKRIHGSCGRVYVGSMERSRYDDRGYRCQGVLPGYLKPGEQSCRDPRFDAEAMEDAVWSQVITLLGDEHRLRALAQDGIARLPGDREKFDERESSLIQGIEKRRDLIERSVTDCIEKGVDEEIIRAARKTLEAELAGMEAHLEEVRYWLKQDDDAAERIDRIAALASWTVERLRSMSRAERAEIIALLDIEVKPQDHRVTVGTGGVKSEAFEWHVRTGILVPDEVAEDDWAMVEDFLRRRGSLPRLRGGSHPGMIINGILLKLRTGIAWHRMPAEYGHWRKVHRWQFVWARQGLWPDLVALLNQRGGGTPVHRPPLVPPFTVTGRLEPDAVPAPTAGPRAVTDGDAPARPVPPDMIGIPVAPVPDSHPE